MAFGAFHTTNVLNSGLMMFRKWAMSATQKARIRKSLKVIDSNRKALNECGVKIKYLDQVNAEQPGYSMTPLQKYTYFCNKIERRVPLHHHAKFTKTLIDRSDPIEFIPRETPKVHNYKKFSKYGFTKDHVVVVRH